MQLSFCATRTKPEIIRSVQVIARKGLLRLGRILSTYERERLSRSGSMVVGSSAGSKPLAMPAKDVTSILVCRRNGSKARRYAERRTRLGPPAARKGQYASAGILRNERSWRWSE